MDHGSMDLKQLGQEGPGRHFDRIRNGKIIRSGKSAIHCHLKGVWGVSSLLEIGEVFVQWAISGLYFYQEPGLTITAYQ